MPWDCFLGPNLCNLEYVCGSVYTMSPQLLNKTSSCSMQQAEQHHHQFWPSCRLMPWRHTKGTTRAACQSVAVLCTSATEGQAKAAGQTI
jgi:hypothetical protein